MKSVIQRMEENNTAQKIAWFRMRQTWSYKHKIQHAERMVHNFYDAICYKHEANVHISVGGLDSITLLLFIRSLGYDIPAISVSSLEDKSIQKIHQQLGVIPLRPLKSKVEVIREFGWPVLSKEIAGKIDTLQHPTANNATVRHAIITGETGAYGGNRTETRMKMSKKWLELFGGLANESEGVNYKIAPFQVSDKCCYYLKEKPCDDYAKEHNSYPYLGLMASEGGRRQKALAMNGCNYISETTKRSAPFAIFTRQDLLQLALDLNVPVPAIYGTIERKMDGTLYTTKAQRTGCSMCGFGVHMEKRPHRFDRLREDNPQEWEFWMNHVMQDATGAWYGWGRVLDYIGVGWNDDPYGNLEGQLDLFGGCVG